MRPAPRPGAGGERGAPHETGRPDVAEHAALVAQPVHEAGLAEQLVELGPVLLGHLRADLGRELGHVGALEVAAFDRDPDRPQQRVGQLERAGLGDVEAVEQAVADQVEVPVDRGAGLARQRAELGEDVGGVAVGREERTASGSSAIVLSRSSSSEPPADTGAEPRIIRGARRGQPRPVADVGEEVAGGDHRPGGEAHVLQDHRRVVVAAPREVRDELVVGERVGVDGLDLSVLRDRRRLDLLVPLAQLLAPELLGEHLFGALRSAAGSPPRERDAPGCTRSR